MSPQCDVYEQLYVATIIRLHINAPVQFVLGALPVRVATESTSAERGSVPWTAAAGWTYFRGQRTALTAHGWTENNQLTVRLLVFFFALFRKSLLHLCIRRRKMSGGSIIGTIDLVQ